MASKNFSLSRLVYSETTLERLHAISQLYTLAHANHPLSYPDTSPPLKSLSLHAKQINSVINKSYGQQSNLRNHMQVCDYKVT